MNVVLVLDHAFVSGGQSQVAFDSARGLREAGHRPIVFTAVGPVDPDLAAAGIEVICLGQSDLLHHPSAARAAVQGIWNSKAAAALGSVLQSLPRDNTVVHVHGWAKALSPAIAQPIVASGLRAVYTMHEYFLLCPNGGFYNYRHQHACHLKPLSAACWATNCDSRSYSRKIWRNLRGVVMEKIAALPTAFTDLICISQFQVDEIGARLPAGPQVHRVSNPIAAVDHGPKPQGRGGDLMFIGRVAPEKGPLLYAEAARKAGMRPIFVGDGPSRAEVEARFPEALMLGWASHDQVIEHLRRARALVFPSRWYEGQPLTVLEALSQGTPVIVSDGCAARDSVIDGVNGLWFRNGDVDDLARALTMMQDGGLADRLAAGAYQTYWADPLTLQRHVAALERIYRGLAASDAMPRSRREARAA